MYKRLDILQPVRFQSTVELFLRKYINLFIQLVFYIQEIAPQTQSRELMQSHHQYPYYKCPSYWPLCYCILQLHVLNVLLPSLLLYLTTIALSIALCVTVSYNYCSFYYWQSFSDNMFTP